MTKTEFQLQLNENLNPINEVFSSNNFTEWRMSYGIHTKDPNPVYFLSIYPAFCRFPKFTIHYSSLDEVVFDISEIEELATKSESWVLSDIVAALFAILRDKESIELFQEQKDLMDLGLKHFRLDNYYQDQIRTLCKEVSQTDGTLFGQTVSLHAFDKIKDGVNGKK